MTFTEQMLSEGKINVKQNVSVLYCWKNIGLQNMHQIEIAYVSKKNVELEIQKKVGLSENVNIGKIFIMKSCNERRYSNCNMSFLPINEWTIDLEAEFKRFVQREK